MKITLDANPSDAPCCIMIVADNGEDGLIQTDWDFPGVASTFGWSIQDVQKDTENLCQHTNTDGTVKCKDCGLEPGDFISAARQWIDENDGAEVDDPGYFDGE